MMLSRHLEQLQEEQELETAQLKLETRAALRAASPRRLVQRYPFICIGAAVVLGMKVAPRPHRSGGSTSNPGHAGVFSSVNGWIKKMMPLLGFGGTPPIKDHSVPREAVAGVAGNDNSVVTQVMLGIQALSGVIEKLRPAGASMFEIAIADAGSIETNSLETHLMVGEGGKKSPC